MTRNLALAFLMLTLGVAVAETQRGANGRPSARGVQRVEVALVAGVARAGHAATIGVWSTVLSAAPTPVLVAEVNV